MLSFQIKNRRHDWAKVIIEVVNLVITPAIKIDWPMPGLMTAGDLSIEDEKL